MEPKQGYFLFVKARNEELCQDRRQPVLCKLPMCSCEGTRVQPVLFQPQAIVEKVGNQDLAGRALSWLFLSCVFTACLSGEWKASLCMLLLQAGPVHFQLEHCWCVCLMLLFIHLFIWGVGVTSLPMGCTLCKQKQPLQPVSTLTTTPGDGSKLTHVYLYARKVIPRFWRQTSDLNLFAQSAEGF